MNNFLHKRLQRIEAVVLPLPPASPVVVKLLGEPPADASPAAVQTFEHELEMLRASGCQVIVLRALRSMRQMPKGVESHASEAEAQIAVAARSPSNAGHLSQLDDALRGLTGRVVGPVVLGPEQVG